MTTYLWTINQLDRLTSNGFVEMVHYNVSATDGDHEASIYGSINYTQTSGETYIPYDDLTQAVVVGWVQETLGKDTVEASLQGQIDALKTPVQQSGLPWVTA
jgi:hypothetical protein